MHVIAAEQMRSRTRAFGKPGPVMTHTKEYPAVLGLGDKVIHLNQVGHGLA